VALTFDDGSNPLSTPELLDLLSLRRVNATFFVNGDKAARHPQIIREILARGHTIGNHTYRHDNFIMLHDIPPRGGNKSEDWFREVDRLLSGIEEGGPCPYAEGR
jgi:peptidoglycan/xylan/chitin deacetylase (PgdA/CDA1 family)